MHVYYKFGLLVIFILSISICHIHAAPANDQKIIATASSENNYDYDDYYDDQTADEQKIAVAAITTTTTTTYRPFFYIPRRSNHVLEPSCPRACICREDFKYVQCSHAQLTQVPHDLPRTAAIIDLSHNAITELHADDFANCSKLLDINLNGNQLTKLNREHFTGLVRLQRLRLANNRLMEIAPDTFTEASDLSLLDLSNNSIALNADGSFLNQPGLLELSCNNCSWTQLYDQTFVNLSSLTTLRLQHNDFKKKINTRAFVPLRNLIKLKLPELEQSSIQELCNLLKTIDNISFKHFDISCFELVLGFTYNESLVFATDPPFKRVTGLDTTTTTTKLPVNATKVIAAGGTATHNRKTTKMASDTSSNYTQQLLTLETNTSSSTAPELVKASVLNSETEPEKPYQVPISQEAINTLLICIMVLAIIGIIIGLICRKDIGGIKTKCCRTSKPEPKDQVHPTEEIPLNKIA